MIKHHLTQEDVKEAMWFCPERLRPHASVEVQKIREILPPDFQTYTEVKLLPELEQTMDAVAAALV